MRAPSRVLAALLAAVVGLAGSAVSTGCATERSAAAGEAGASGGSGSGALSDTLASRARQGDLGEFDLTDAALIASGYESRPGLRGARARFEALVAPIVEEVKNVPDPHERGRLLLVALHRKGALLGAYDARATTLDAILDERRYNCVSASVLYNLLAERLDLTVTAQLLPTHARSLVRMPGARRALVVETTSPDGFDPDPRLQAAIRAQVGGVITEGARALVPDRGAVVTTQVLIGAIYINRASIAQEAGDFAGAARLFEHGESFAQSREMARILRDQRAALLSQLAADDVLSEDRGRLDRAYRTLKAAAALDPREPQIRAAVFQNLRAAVERMIHDRADKADEPGLLALAGEGAGLGLEAAERAGMRAFALSEVARVRIDRGDFDGAVDAIEHALEEHLGPRDAGLKQTLEHNRISALRLAAVSTAKKGDLAHAMQLVERLRALPGLTAAQRREADEDLLRAIHAAGNKRLTDNDFKGAVEVYREGVRRFPADATCRQNMVAALERLAVPLVNGSKCAEASEYLDEIRTVDPASAFAMSASSRCLMARAKERLEAQDYAEAVSLMRAARQANPAEAAVVSNLAVALLRWTSSLSASGSCARAATIARELRGLAVATISPGDVKRALGQCQN